MTQLATRNFSMKRSMVNEWYAKPEPDTPLEAVLEPKYWAHCSAKLAPENTIIVIPEGAPWRAELMVLDAGRGFAKVVVLSFVEIEAHEVTGDQPTADEYDVRWAGPHAKWRVIRKSDKRVMIEERPTKQDGYLWIASHRKAMAA
jgi:hypothetical protein